MGAIGLFAVLSVLGAFLGADRAKAMFTSAPLALFWALLAGLVAARLLRFDKLVRLPGLLPLYLGPLLILLGSMYGSATGHSVAGRLFGSKKIPRGYMVIPEVATSDELLDRELGRRIARLPAGAAPCRLPIRRPAARWRAVSRRCGTRARQRRACRPGHCRRSP